MPWWERVDRLREQRGWTWKELAKQARLPYDVIRKYSQGAVANPRGDAFTKLATALGVSASYLEYGNTLPVMTIPVMGVVGAGEKLFPDETGILDQIKINAEEMDLFAVTIRGDSGQPVYKPGEIAVCSRVAGLSENGFLNYDCIVKLVTGESYIKKVVRGAKPGLYTLLSNQGEPISDVRLDWAAPVVFVIRRPGLLIKD